MVKDKNVTVTTEMDAPADVVYSVIADYHIGHPQILPRPPFVSLAVERGGTGAGTVINVTMRVLGRLQSFRSTVSEPIPGRVLVENNDTGYSTTFSVDPIAENRARVTISTRLEKGGGVLDNIQMALVSRLLKPVYIEELKLLEGVSTAATAKNVEI